MEVVLGVIFKASIIVVQAKKGRICLPGQICMIFIVICSIMNVL